MSPPAPASPNRWTDPLTLAAKRLVDQGIVAVAAAGNLGLNAQGEKQYGGILSPGNAPWVLTVGASSTEGTIDTADDTLQPSARADRPGRLPRQARSRCARLRHPVVRRAGIPALQREQRLPRRRHRQHRLSALCKPQRDQHGGSASGGAVALMFQADSALTPNLAKGILRARLKCTLATTRLNRALDF